ncbi:MAG: RNase adapter RapZ [Alphaproteobacteria bacterium]|nr:RNase adapter RapZ [Alphaproteobacteria bacterium]
MTEHRQEQVVPKGPLREILIVTGMSGAGLSSALKVFEDLGYEVVDNLRLSLIPTLVDAATDSPALAISIDTRNANFSVDCVLQTYEALAKKEGLTVKLVYLECSDEALQRRFTETRRRHPMAVDRTVSDGIRTEREMLWRLRECADHVLDTSALSVHELRRHLAGHFRLETEADLSLFVTSFSYRMGLPREADLVVDVRFLANPHWDLHLRTMTGQEPAVVDYIKKDEHYQPFMDKLVDMIVPLLPLYKYEGKRYLTFAIGCTGGRHRSVFIAEQLATSLAKHGYIVGVGHRDMDRPQSKA